jgi:hypothetical protein
VAIAFYFTVSLVLRYYDTNNQYFNFSNDPYTIITSSEGTTKIVCVCACVRVRWCVCVCRC